MKLKTFLFITSLCICSTLSWGQTTLNSGYLDFGDEQYVRIYMIDAPSYLLFEDDGTYAANSSNTKGITYLGYYGRNQYPDMQDMFKLEKVGVSGDKILYTIYSEGEGGGSGSGGGYLTDATNLAFNSDGSVKNPDYLWQNWVRLSFEAEPSNNSYFAFSRIVAGSSDFVIETSSSDNFTRSHVKIQNGIPVISRSSIEDILISAARLNVHQVAGPANLSVLPDSLDFVASGEQQAFAIISDTDWTVSSNVSWLAFYRHRGVIMLR